MTFANTCIRHTQYAFTFSGLTLVLEINETQEISEKNLNYPPRYINLIITTIFYYLFMYIRYNNFTSQLLDLEIISLCLIVSLKVLFVLKNTSSLWNPCVNNSTQFLI